MTVKPHHLHRAWDQDTSVLAADAIAPSVSVMQEAVTIYAYCCGPRGFSDVDLNLNFKCTSSAYRSRRAELARKGIIKDSGLRQKLATGRTAIVWVHEKFAKKEGWE